MATGATNGGRGLTGWIAGGSAAVLLGITGLYFTGYLAPEPATTTPLATLEDNPATPTPIPQDPLPDTASDTAPETVSTPEQSASAEPTPETTPQVDAADPAPTLLAPSFDVVRVDPEGNTVIAGTGTPGARVTIFLDDGEQISTVIDRAGAFVSLLSIPTSTTPRVLSMIADLNGAQMPSDDQIILAPTPVAAAETTPESTPEPQVAQAETTTPEPADDTQLAQIEPQTEQPAVLEPAQPVEDQTAETQTPLTEATETVTAPSDPQSQPDQPATQTATAPTPTESTAQTAAQTPTEPATPSTPDIVAETQTAPETPVAQAPQASAAAESAAETTETTVPTTTTQQVGDTVQTAALEPAPVEPAVTPSEPVAEATSEPTSEGVATATPIPTVPATQPTPPAPDQTAPEPSPDAAATTPVDPATETVASEAPTTEPKPTPTTVAVLRANRDGVEVLQPATPAPSALDKIALDTISYSETGQVQLSGRAQGQSLVRVYLDNTAVADLESDSDGRWSGQIEGIEPGIYTLRLDELGADGAVLSRLETPFKRESPEVLNPPQDPVVTAQADSSGETPTPAPAPLVRAVTVQRGDTLWAISRERYGEGVLYVRLFEANRADIRDPDLIYPGQVFTIPD